METIHFKVLSKETVVLDEKEEKDFNKLEHEKALSQKYNASVVLIKTVVYTPVASSSTEIVTEP